MVVEKKGKTCQGLRTVEGAQILACFSLLGFIMVSPAMEFALRCVLPLYTSATC